jgi:hypothetical protein
MEAGNWESILLLLRGSTDEEKFAGLLMLTKTDASCVLREHGSEIFEAIGLTFLLRLLQSHNPESEAYIRVAVTILSSFCSISECINDPDFLHCAPLALRALEDHVVAGDHSVLLDALCILSTICRVSTKPVPSLSTTHSLHTILSHLAHPEQDLKAFLPWVLDVVEHAFLSSGVSSGNNDDSSSSSSSSSRSGGGESSKLHSKNHPRPLPLLAAKDEHLLLRALSTLTRTSASADDLTHTLSLSIRTLTLLASQSPLTIEMEEELTPSTAPSTQSLSLQSMQDWQDLLHGLLRQHQGYNQPWYGSVLLLVALAQDRWPLFVTTATAADKINDQNQTFLLFPIFAVGLHAWLAAADLAASTLSLGDPAILTVLGRMLLPFCSAMGEFDESENESIDRPVGWDLSTWTAAQKKMSTLAISGILQRLSEVIQRTTRVDELLLTSIHPQIHPFVAFNLLCSISAMGYAAASPNLVLPVCEHVWMLFSSPPKVEEEKEKEKEKDSEKKNKIKLQEINAQAQSVLAALVLPLLAWPSDSSWAQSALSAGVCALGFQLLIFLCHCEKSEEKDTAAGEEELMLRESLGMGLLSLMWRRPMDWKMSEKDVMRWEEYYRQIQERWIWEGEEKDVLLLTVLWMGLLLSGKDLLDDEWKKVTMHGLHTLKIMPLSCIGKNGLWVDNIAPQRFLLLTQTAIDVVRANRKLVATHSRPEWRKTENMLVRNDDEDIIAVFQTFLELLPH